MNAVVEVTPGRRIWIEVQEPLTGSTTDFRTIVVEAEQDEKISVVNVSDLRNFGGDKNYVHNQQVPSAEWTVVHNLGKRPAVTITDTAGREVLTDILHDSINQFRSISRAPFSGKADCN